MDQPTNVLRVENETSAQSTRITADSRRLTYKMRVLQQPVRARACGAGAKSSADRRPVDPPPIIELKVFEGENADKDITSTITANYFLFATLEQARHIAQGRVPEDKSRATALAGTAVSGMVLLERPAPAGYFIFPDLSVRHEGKYRLSFSLYEELRNPSDYDNLELPGLAPSDSSAHDHVTHRLEVRSLPFTVYSAKKFPGLTESTELSRCVAEQGCRVRIRRDVRMRRRESEKGPGKDWDAYEEHTAAARARISATPEVNHFSPYGDIVGRPRSSSNVSHHMLHDPLSRRQSVQDMKLSYPQQSFMPPGTPQHEPQSAMSYGPSPVQGYSQAPYVQSQPTMQPPSSFQSPMTSASPSNYYSYASATPQVSQPHPPPPNPFGTNHHVHRHSLDQPMQAQSLDGGLPPMAASPSHLHFPPPTSSSFFPSPVTQASQGLGNHPSPGSASQHTYLRPETTEPPRITNMHSANNSALPSLLAPDHKFPPVPCSPVSLSDSNSQEPSHKRNYGSVFGDRHLSQSLRCGARPYTGHSMLANMDADCDTGDAGEELCDPRSLAMRYKRADGSSVIRALPPHVKLSVT